MKLEWLGEYREIIEKIIKFGNSYASRYQKESYAGTPVLFSAIQLQTMEYILENEEKHQNMAEVAARLGVSPSAFSKNVKKMLEKGLLEKYHTANNRKNVVVKISPLGRKIYADYSKYALEHHFKPLFQILDEIPKEYIEKFAQVLDRWAESEDIEDTTEDVPLIRIE